MKYITKKGIFIVALACAATVSTFAERAIQTVESNKHDFVVVEVATGLSRPWSLAFLPNGDLLVTERTGKLKRISEESSVTIGGVPDVVSRGQGGLLDVVLDPAFESNRLIYLSYSDSYNRGYGTRIGRGRLIGDALVDFQVIFTMNNPTRATHHFGSRLAFGPDETLFFSIGDRGERDRAQDLSDDAGKIHRINPDGSLPSDNPYIGQRNANDTVYSYGHRNVQGMVFDSNTGILWTHEHGPKGGDEVNIVQPSVNYGWPIITYGREYSGGYIAPSEKPGLEQPIIHWTPSIAPSGLAVYYGTEFPEWQGNLFAGALVGQQLRRMTVVDDSIVDQEILLENSIGRIRDVRVGLKGKLWLVTDAAAGRILKLERAE